MPIRLDTLLEKVERMPKQEGIPIAHLTPTLNSFRANVNKLTEKRWQKGTVRNCVKSTKLFCDMADLQIPRAKIVGVKSTNQA